MASDPASSSRVADKDEATMKAPSKDPKEKNEDLLEEDLTPEDLRSQNESKPLRKKDEYEMIGLVGKGCFGEVWQAIRKRDNSLWALKKVELVYQDCEEEESPLFVFTKHMARECLLYDLDHENIVRLEDTFIDDGHMCYVLEYMDGTLSSFFTVPLGEHPTLMKNLLRQILFGMEYLHSENVIHRDLKPSNILLKGPRDEGTSSLVLKIGDSSSLVLKIGDFGLARFATRKEITPGVGSTNYHPPEVLLGSPYSMAADMWSVGCLFAYMFEGDDLFQGTSESAVFKNVCSVIGTPDSEILPTIRALPGWFLLVDSISEFPIYPREEFLNNYKRLGPLGLDLLLRLLSFDPKERISATDALKHPYFEDS